MITELGDGGEGSFGPKGRDGSAWWGGGHGPGSPTNEYTTELHCVCTCSSVAPPLLRCSRCGLLSRRGEEDLHRWRPVSGREPDRIHPLGDHTLSAGSTSSATVGCASGRRRSKLIRFFPLYSVKQTPSMNRQQEQDYAKREQKRADILSGGVCEHC